MPEQLTEVEAKTQDATVAKQWDDETPVEQKLEDFYAIADKLPVCMMGTARPGLGVRYRSTLIARQTLLTSVV